MNSFSFDRISSALGRGVLPLLALLLLLSAGAARAQAPGAPPPPPPGENAILPAPVETPVPVGTPAPAAAEKPAPAPKAGKKGGPDQAEQLYDIDMADQKILSIIKTFAKRLGRNFLIDSKVRSNSNVTFISPRRVTFGEMEKIFESILHSQGLTLIPGPNKTFYKVVNEKEAITDTLPLFTRPSLVPGRTTDLFITRLLPLENVEAKSLEPVVKKFISREGDITSYERTNVLILTETSANINRVIKLIKSLDVPEEDEVRKIIQINYADVADIDKQIKDIFKSSSGGGGAKVVRGRGRAGAAVSSAGEDYRTVIDQRTNRIIIIGKESRVKEITEFIPELDQPIDQLNEIIKVYPLQYADAEELVKTIENLNKSSSSKQAAKGKSNIPRLPNQPAAATAPGVITAEFEGEFKITAHKPLNALVITATPQDYRKLAQVIKKLDIRRRQVYVEAAVIQVDVSSNWSMGIAGGGGAERNGTILFGQSNVGGMSPYSNIAQTGTTTTTTTTTTGNAFAGALASMAGGGGLTTGILGKDLEIGGITIPTYAAVLNAAKGDSDANVLSTPTIMTTDNEEAEIVVGQNIPIPTGQTVGTSGVTTSTINRENVGITMRIKPQISEGDTVRLEINVEVSNVSQEDLGIDVNSTGIVTAERTAKTTVLVEDHQPVVIGGLMEDRQGMTASKIPILGDLPILGWLFKQQQTNSRKTNLIIFITPHIVRTRNDAEVISLEQLRDHAADIANDEFVERLKDTVAFPQEEYNLEMENEEESMEIIRSHMPPGSMIIMRDGSEYRAPGSGEVSSPAQPGEGEDDSMDDLGGDVSEPQWMLEKRRKEKMTQGQPASAPTPSSAPTIKTPAIPPGALDKYPQEVRDQVRDQVNQIRNDLNRLKKETGKSGGEKTE